MYFYFFYKNTKFLYTKALHVGCIPQDGEFLLIRGSEIVQPRAICENCGRMLNKKAADKYLAKRDLNKPLRDLMKISIHKVNKDYFDLAQGDEILLSKVPFSEIKAYVFTNFNPSAKIKPEFEELLFKKLNGINSIKK